MIFMKIKSCLVLLIICNSQAIFASQTCWQQLQNSCCCSWLFQSQRKQTREEWLAENLQSPTSLQTADSEAEMRSPTPPILRQNFSPNSPARPNVRPQAQAPSPEHSPYNSPKALKNLQNSKQTFSPPPSLVAFDTRLAPFATNESPIGSPTSFDQVDSEEYQLPQATTKPAKGSWWPLFR